MVKVRIKKKNIAKNALKKGSMPFQSEGRLLQELGERLVASGEVAIVELIKNAYDADASICEVQTPDEYTLIIKDDGHGITLSEFKTNWMRIASRFKEQIQYSRGYKRKLTGAKGIGRFAVRYWGKKLTLQSIAFDSDSGHKTRLVAKFDWTIFDKTFDLSKVKVPYALYGEDNNVQTGTELIIEELQGPLDQILSDDIRTEVLKIVSPLSGLNRGWFGKKHRKSSSDPGFKLILPSFEDSGDVKDENLAGKILNNYWARLLVSLRNGTLEYKIFLPQNTEPVFSTKLSFKTSVRQGAFADIRFFPRRSGIFSGKGINGWEAWRWIKDNCGVAVVDHGFRITPYGYGDDDWLKLNVDKAANRRDWRSDITQNIFPIPQEIKQDPSLNPMLYLPANHQLVGAVFVESGHTKNLSDASDLIPSMDREGYLKNEAFDELVNVVRAGIELLAQIDKNEEERKAEEEAKKETEKIRDDFKIAIKQIERIPTLTRSDKAAIVKEYAYLAENIERVDEYNRRARQGLETMSLLGVVAGFMTHESDRIRHNIEQLIVVLKALSTKHPEVKKELDELENNYKELAEHIDYTRTFIDNVHIGQAHPFKVLPQIKRIINKFGQFATERGVKIQTDVDKELEAPSVSIAIYSGIILNLYTNALKAIVAGKSSISEPTIAFKSWNEPKKHIIEVIDNGIGISPELMARIWDPLFTTTSTKNNPLGSGMGLGLSIVKRILSDINGAIKLVEPPPGFSTCFRVELPR